MEPKLSRNKRKTFLPSILQTSLLINIFFVIFLINLYLVNNECSTNSRDGNSRNYVTELKTVWHGGHPSEDRSGSCWCGIDKYCMCTPNLAIDLIITSGGRNAEGATIVDFFWLVRRKDTDKLATMGGFVELHETVENAIKRELMEEMALILSENPTLIGVYSDPRRDNRRRTASVVFAVHFPGEIRPHAGDDAKEVVKIAIDEVENHSFFSDHQTILLDYRSTLRGEKNERHSTEGDFGGDIIRSTCGLSN